MKPRSLQLNRPCRVPGETEAKHTLAKDLSQGNWDKARVLLHLPLFMVALEGNPGVAIAEAWYRRRKAA